MRLDRQPPDHPLPAPLKALREGEKKRGWENVANDVDDPYQVICHVERDGSPLTQPPEGCHWGGGEEKAPKPCHLLIFNISLCYRPNTDFMQYHFTYTSAPSPPPAPPAHRLLRGIKQKRHRGGPFAPPLAASPTIPSPSLSPTALASRRPAPGLGWLTMLADGVGFRERSRQGMGGVRGKKKAGNNGGGYGSPVSLAGAERAEEDGDVNGSPFYRIEPARAGRGGAKRARLSGEVRAHA